MEQHHGHAAPEGQQEWQASLCDCTPCSSCMLSCFLPCMLYGRTASRERDPSLQSEDMVNGDCALFGAVECFTGCAWLFTFFKRTEIRHQYGIQGSECGDCCTTFWYHCCALVQQDNEVKLRQAAAHGQSAPITQAYQGQQQGMQVPAPIPAHAISEKPNPQAL